MARYLNKALAMLIIFALILSTIPQTAITALAAPDDTPTSSTVESTDISNSSQSIDSLQSVAGTEDISKRGECYKNYKLANGLGEYEIYSEPINYKDSNGNYQSIDNSLQLITDSDGQQKYINKANNFSALISVNNSNKWNVELLKDDYSISWKLLGDMTTQTGSMKSMLTSAQWNKQTEGQKRHTVPNLSSEVKFASVLNNIDLQYHLESNYVKQNLVINTYTDVPTLAEKVELKGLNAISQNDGSINFVDSKTNDVIFVMPTPCMFDSKGNYCDIAYSITQTGNDCTLTYTLDTEWLKAAVYPVIIDPTVSVPNGATVVDDTKLVEAYPNSNYHLQTTFATGYTDSGHRLYSLVRFNDLPTIPNPNHIYAACIRLTTEMDSDASSVGVCEVTSDWTSSSVTWGTKPTFGSIYSTCAVTGASGQYCQFNIKDIAKYWYNTNNYGLLLKATVDTAAYMLWYSSDASSGQPNASIAYDDTAPTQATSVTTNPLATSSWTNIATPTIKWSGITDAGGSGLANVQYQINGGTWTNTNVVDGTVGYTLPSGKLTSSGTYTISVRGIDGSGNLGTSNSTTYKLDLNNPAPVITAPTEDTYVAGTVAVKGTVTDVHSGISSWKLEYGAGESPTSWTQIATGTSAIATEAKLVDWNTGALTNNAVYTLRLTATDKVSHSIYMDVHVTVDNLNPVPTIINPVDNTVLEPVSGGISIHGWVTDPRPDFKNWVLEYGKGISPSSWTQISTGTEVEDAEDFPLGFPFGMINSINLEVATTYTIRLTATNNAGISHSSCVQFINNPAYRLGDKDYWTYSGFNTGSGSGSVNVSSGNLVYQSTDFSFPSLIPMDMTRTYNSQSKIDSVLGQGWDFSFDILLCPMSDGGMLIKEGDGSLDRFSYKSSDGTYSPETGLFMKLSKIGDGTWQATGKNNIMYLFNSDYSLSKIVDLNGNYLQYAYNADGTIHTIISSANEVVTFTYTTSTDAGGSGLLKTVTDPANRVFTYTYNSARQLVKRSFTLDSTHNWTEQFTYNTSGLLSGITDGKGNQTTLLYDSSNRVTKVTYPITSLYMTYTYEDAQNTIVSNQLEQDTTYSYDSNGLVTRITDPIWTFDAHGHYINYTYDQNKFLVTTTSTTNYNPVDQTSMAITWNYTYDANGNLTQSIDPLGHYTVYEYNLFNEMTYKRVKNTDNVTDYAVTHYVYDTFGNLTTTYAPNLDKVVYLYNNIYGLVTTESSFPYYSSVQGGYLANPSTNVSYSYEPTHHWLNQTTKSSGLTTKMLQFDGMGNPTYVKDENGNTSKMVYDLLGRIIQDYQALSGVSESNPGSANWGSDPVETTTYDLDGNVLTSISNTGLETDSVYDALNRMTSTTVDPSDKNAISTIAYSYDANGNSVETSTDESTGITSIDYCNVLGQKVKTESSGSTTTFDYDTVGNQADSITSIEGNATVNKTINKYDKLNRITDTYEDATASNIHSTMIYDLLGNVTDRNDGQGSDTVSVYDLVNRLQSETLTKNGNLYTTTYTYDNPDGSGNTYNTVTDINGTKETFTNSDGDLIKETAILAGGTTFTTQYDNSGSPTDIYVGSSNQRDLAHNTYDASQGSNNLVLFQMPSLAQKSFSYNINNFATVEKYENDPVQVDRFNYVYNKFGNVENVKDNVNNLETRYTYDSANRISTVNEGVIGFINPTHSYTVSYANGNISSISETINGQTSTISYLYDDNNLICSANFNYGSGNTSKTTWFYDNYNRINARNVYDGNANEIFTTTTGYTENSNMTSYISTIENKQIGQNGYDKTLTYGYNTNAIKSINSIYDGTNYTTYVYDDRERLIRENNQAAGKTWTWEYYQDGTTHGGNIHYKKEYAYTTADNPGTPLTTITYSYNDTQGWTDLLTSCNGNTITYYTGSGNPQSDGTWTYSWEAGHNLIGLSKTGTSVSFTYNQDGIRTSKTVNGVATKYTLVNGQVTSETTGINVVSFRYDCNGKPISMETGGIEYYYFMDAQNDIIGMFDHNGNVVVQYAYDAWGKLISETDGSGSDKMNDSSFIGNINPYRYRGYWYDIYDYVSGFGLYYLQSRYYNPSWERFINADTVDYSGENMFVYCNNNPITNTDIDGHDSTTSLSPEFFYVNDGTNLYYGGFQQWFNNPNQPNGATMNARGCGPVAAANMMCYEAMTNKSKSKLYDYKFVEGADDVPFADFYKYMVKVYNTLKPGAWGTWNLASFKSGINTFAKARGITLSFNIQWIWLSTGYIKTSMNTQVNFIKKGLKANCPVALLIAFNSRVSYQKHWITITKIHDDQSTSSREITVTVSTWGSRQYMDYIKYYNGILPWSVVDGLIYFK